MSSPKKIDHNPAAAHVWLREKGAPWRAQHEFLQIQVDEKAKKELDAKYDVRMAKQCAIGIKNMYGLDFDFAMLQFAIKDAKALFNDEHPAKSMYAKQPTAHTSQPRPYDSFFIISGEMYLAFRANSRPAQCSPHPHTFC